MRWEESLLVLVSYWLLLNSGEKFSKVPLGDFREGDNLLGDFSLGTFAFEYAHLKLMGSVKPQSYIKVTSKPKKTIVEPGSFENFNLWMWPLVCGLQTKIDMNKMTKNVIREQLPCLPISKP